MAISELERDLSVYCELPAGITWRFVTGSIVIGSWA
jgi:hypothetical protein